MNRSLIVFVVLLLFAYLSALGWTAADYSSYSIGKEKLALDDMDVRQGTLDESLNLALHGAGFTEDSRVFMHMDVNNHSAEIGSLPIEGGLYDMEIVDDILYLAGNNAGVRRIDISSPRYPKVVGTPYHAKSPVLDIEKNGDFLYLSCGKQGVKIARIGAGGRLGNWKNIPTWKVAIASKVLGHYLYVAAGSGGLLIYDLEQLGDLKPVARVGGGRPFRGIDAFGDYLYVVAGSDGLLIFKTGDSIVPSLVGQLATEKPVKSVTITDDGQLYVLENGLISQYFLANPQKPKLIAMQRHFSAPQRLFHAGDKLYVADNHSGLGIIDNSNNLLPETADFLSVSGNVGAVVPVGDYLYVAVSKAGLLVLDPKAMLTRNVVRSVDTAGSLVDFVIIDDQMFTIDSVAGLLLHNLSDLQAEPRKLNETRLGKLTYKDSFLYVANSVGESGVFDVSQPADPVLMNKWPNLQANHFAVDGDYLVAVHSGTGLTLAKMQADKKIDIVDQVSGNGSVKVLVKNELVIVAGEVDGVRLYRIANDKLTLVGRVKLPFPLDQFSGALNLDIVAETLFVANGKGGLLIVDIANPEQPLLLSSLSLPGYTNDFLIEGDTAYVTSRYSGLHTIDIRDLHSPRLLDTINISDLAGGLQRYDDLIFLGNRFMGVTAIPFPREITNFSKRTAEKLEITVPPPVFPGRYSLEVGDREGSVVLDGVLRYQ